MSSQAKIYSLVAVVLVALAAGALLLFSFNSPESPMAANQPTQKSETSSESSSTQGEQTVSGGTTEEQRTTPPEKTKQEKTESGEQAAAEQRDAEQRAAEQQAAEQQAAEQQAAEQQAAEQQAAEQQKKWREIAEQRDAEQRDAAQRRAAEQQAEEEAQPTVPTNTALSLTAPTAGIQNDPVTDSIAESVLANGAGKIPSTGFPWQSGSNTYIAAHVYGYPGTGSWQQFARVPNMSMGDPIFLTDSNGTTYEYRVNEILNVAPTDVWVAQSTGQTTVSLQTCVGPNWSERLVVRGTLVGTSSA